MSASEKLRCIDDHDASSTINLNGYLMNSAHSAHSADAVNSTHAVNSAHSAHSADAKDAATWDAPIPFHTGNIPTFPTSAFPPVLAGFVSAEAEATQTPPDLTGMLVLSALAVACQTKVEIEVRPGYREPANVYTASVLGPGNRKTQVVKDVNAPIFRFEWEVNDRMRHEVEAAQARYKMLQKRVERAQDIAAKADRGERDEKENDALDLVRELSMMQVPTLLRLVADDVSPEKLASLLHENGGRMAVLSAEGDIFDTMAGRYSNGTPNLGVFLKGHAGDLLRVDRVGRPAEYIERPALTLGLTVQPDVLQSLGDKPGFDGRGLLARVWYSLPESTLGRRSITPTPVPQSVRDGYERVITNLLALPWAQHSGSIQAAHVLQLDAAAYQQWRDFAAWIEPQLATGGELDAITAWAAKLSGAVTRIAGLLHMATYADDAEPWNRPISEHTYTAAIRIGRYLLAHAQAAFTEMRIDPQIQHAHYLLRVLDKKGVETFTKRDLFNWVRGNTAFKTTDKLDPVLTLLAEHGYIRQRQQATRPGPGQPASPAYDVNPLWHTQNTQNTQNYNQGGAA